MARYIEREESPTRDVDLAMTSDKRENLREESSREEESRQVYLRMRGGELRGPEGGVPLEKENGSPKVSFRFKSLEIWGRESRLDILSISL